MLFAFCSPIIPSVPDDNKQFGALLIAACVIAAIRLRREPIQPSPKLKAIIYDSVQLATMVLQEVRSRRFTSLS